MNFDLILDLSNYSGIGYDKRFQDYFVISHGLLDFRTSPAIINKLARAVYTVQICIDLVYY